MLNLLDSQLQAQGYQSYNESGAEELQALKQLMVTDRQNYARLSDQAPRASTRAGKQQTLKYLK